MKTKQQSEQSSKDIHWWEEFGDLVGWKLFAISNRDWAYFVLPTGDQIAIFSNMKCDIEYSITKK